MTVAKIGATHPELLAALRKLGVDIDNTNRVVIDIPAGAPVHIYTTSAANEALLEVVSSLGTTEVQVLHVSEHAEGG